MSRRTSFGRSTPHGAPPAGELRLVDADSGAGGARPGRRAGLGRVLRASGAVAAQFSQALTSLVFGVLALRVLAVGDFGVLGLLLGGTVLATAVMTGFVGDSLTVLDRRDPRTRAALQCWCLLLAAGLLAVGAGTTLALGLLPAATALLFGCGVAVFVLEDTARRLLMAHLRFWRVVAVDLVYAVTAAAVLLLASGTGQGDLQLEDFLRALLIGQLTALVAAIGLLPTDERTLAPWRDADLRRVLDFGAWRALQQAVRPGALTLIRSLVLAGSGAGALAVFEAGRLYVSPALLLMQGSGSFLLASNAQQRSQSTPVALRSADRVAAALAASGTLLGVLLVLVVPVLGPLLTGGNVAISPGDIAAWSSVAVASGLSMPYGSLAAVRSRPRRVFAVRLVDTAVSLTAVLVLLALPAPARAWLPAALAAGLLTSAALQRRLVAADGPPG